MWILILLSVVSVYVIIERGVVLRQLGDTRAADRARGFLVDGKPQEALEALAGRYGVADVTLRAAIEGGPDAVLPALERARFERGLGFLATVGAHAPFVGLFGTIIGVIGAFHDLSANVKGGQPQRSSSALLCSADGVGASIVKVSKVEVHIASPFDGKGKGCWRGSCPAGMSMFRQRYPSA